MADGISVYVNCPAVTGALVPSGLVTVTLTIPEPTGDVTVIWLAELTVNPVAAVVPNVTAVISINPVPVIVTAVPPAVGPLTGVIRIIAGISVYVNLPVSEGVLVLFGLSLIHISEPTRPY